MPKLSNNGLEPERVRTSSAWLPI